MTAVVNGEGGDSPITYAEIHSELEDVRRILVDLTGTVERLSSIIASVNTRQPGAGRPASAGDAAPPDQDSPPPGESAVPSAAPARTIPPPSTPPSPSVAPNPVDAILGETFGRPT
ncbi:MAG TPA: hypothetical protein VHZ02_12710 [Acidimicrobiales bacterium]|jgi:hypothetical protein|nr:hypothetical protein [Acidimicrobiales bacterium]